VINSKYFEQFNLEKAHPFDEHYIPDHAKYLIIGSFPTHARNYKHTFKFFYAGMGNVFWPVIGKVFNNTFHEDKGKPAIDERKQFLDQKGIGLTDMLVKCYRHQGRSQDHHIIPIKFNDIFNLLRTHTEIKTLIFTGRQEIIGPFGLFKTYCHQQDVPLPTVEKNREKVFEGSFYLGERYFEVLVPYSTSRTVMEEERTDEKELISMYTSCLK
jgi:hypoxanthine-DNA glycosylase